MLQLSWIPCASVILDTVRKSLRRRGYNADVDTESKPLYDQDTKQQKTTIKKLDD